MKTIIKTQYLQLVGLNTLAAKYENLLKEIEKTACEITGDKPNSGSHTGDIIYQSRDLDEGLEIMKISVIDQPIGESNG